jgi:hypothetical protein
MGVVVFLGIWMADFKKFKNYFESLKVKIFPGTSHL